jgi:hypothetical protein
MNDDADRFIPDARSLAALESRARTDGAPAPNDRGDSLSRARAPVERLAAIVVHADVLRREAWHREVELAVPLYERYATEMPIEPGAFVEQSYKYVDTQRPARRGRCTSCAIVRGKEPCLHCGTSGRNDANAACEYCQHGYVTCSVCDGAALTVRATMRHVNDRPIAIRRVLVPTLPASLVHAIEAVVDPLRDPPPALRFELQANVVQSAYRGASAVRAPEFHGHAFEDSLARALEVVKELARYRDAVKSEVRAYAWPLLVVGRDASAMVVIHDAWGAPRLLGL